MIEALSSLTQVSKSLDTSGFPGDLKVFLHLDLRLEVIGKKIK